MARASSAAPSLGEHVALALVAQGAEHGWAVGTRLAPDGDIGRIWTLSRALTYRAIELLVERGLVARRGTAQGRGGDRTLLRPTPRGRQALDAWLDEPVAHLRDVRTELLVKLTLREQAGLPAAPLLAAQRAHLAATIEALTQAEPDDYVDLWRRVSAEAVARFLEAAPSVRNVNA